MNAIRAATSEPFGRRLPPFLPEYLLIDSDALLAETTELPPCGPDLEYDPAFQALEEASRERIAQQYGDTVIPAQEPRWSEVRAAAEGLLLRSKDLRVAVLLARALVKTEGFSALEYGLEIIRGLIERYWDALHPRLDPDDDFDPIVRSNALAPLVDAGALLKDLRFSMVLPVRFGGGLKVRDVEVAAGKMPPRPDEQAFSQAQVDRMFADAVLADPGIASGVGKTLASARALAGALVERVGADRAVDFAPLLALLGLVQQVCARVAPAPAQATQAGAGESQMGVDADRLAPQTEEGMSGEVRNRDDALRMLDTVIEYFERNEPTNPAPLLIRRARRLVSMNFVDIIRDMAPESLKQIESIAGAEQKD